MNGTRLFKPESRDQTAGASLEMVEEVIPREWTCELK